MKKVEDTVQNIKNKVSDLKDNLKPLVSAKEKEVLTPAEELESLQRKIEDNKIELYEESMDTRGIWANSVNKVQLKEKIEAGKIKIDGVYTEKTFSQFPKDLMEKVDKLQLTEEGKKIGEDLKAQTNELHEFILNNNITKIGKQGLQKVDSDQKPESLSSNELAKIQELSLRFKESIDELTKEHISDSNFNDFDNLKKRSEQLIKYITYDDMPLSWEELNNLYQKIDDNSKDCQDFYKDKKVSAKLSSLNEAMEQNRTNIIRYYTRGTIESLEENKSMQYEDIVDLTNKYIPRAEKAIKSLKENASKYEQEFKAENEKIYRNNKVKLKNFKKYLKKYNETANIVIAEIQENIRNIDKEMEKFSGEKDLLPSERTPEFQKLINLKGSEVSHIDGIQKRIKRWQDKLDQHEEYEKQTASQEPKTLSPEKALAKLDKKIEEKTSAVERSKKKLNYNKSALEHLQKGPNADAKKIEAAQAKVDATQAKLERRIEKLERLEQRKARLTQPEVASKETAQPALKTEQQPIKSETPIIKEVKVEKPLDITTTPPPPKVDNNINPAATNVNPEQVKEQNIPQQPNAEKPVNIMINEAMNGKSELEKTLKELSSRQNKLSALEKAQDRDLPAIREEIKAIKKLHNQLAQLEDATLTPAFAKTGQQPPKSQLANAVLEATPEKPINVMINEAMNSKSELEKTLEELNSRRDQLSTLQKAHDSDPAVIYQEIEAIQKLKNKLDQLKDLILKPVLTKTEEQPLKPEWVSAVPRATPEEKIAQKAEVERQKEQFAKKNAKSENKPIVEDNKPKETPVVETTEPEAAKDDKPKETPVVETAEPEDSKDDKPKEINQEKEESGFSLEEQAMLIGVLAVASLFFPALWPLTLAVAGGCVVYDTVQVVSSAAKVTHDAGKAVVSGVKSGYETLVGKDKEPVVTNNKEDLLNQEIPRHVETEIANLKAQLDDLKAQQQQLKDVNHGTEKPLQNPAVGQDALKPAPEQPKEQHMPHVERLKRTQSQPVISKPKQEGEHSHKSLTRSTSHGDLINKQKQDAEINQSQNYK